MRDDPTHAILDLCRASGFARVGVCDVAPVDRPDAYRAWLDDGKHGEMGYLARHVGLRIDPGKMIEGAKSIICVADRYAVGHHDDDERSASAQAAPRHDSESQEGRHRPRGRVARYARGDDYHRVMKSRLYALCDVLRERYPGSIFRACVDTAPVMEREFASRAGIGSIGKHTLLIERGVGSYLLLGEIITTLELHPSEPARPDPCSGCTRCIDACPTDAITPWSVDATRCISYLTIEHRSSIDEQFHEAMGDWIFGCDICQEVCPHNQPTHQKGGHEVHPAYAERNKSFDLLEVLGWSEEDRRRAFRRSSMKRAKLDMMKRNAALALGNALRLHANSELEAPLQSLANDAEASAMVRDAARSALRCSTGEVHRRA